MESIYNTTTESTEVLSYPPKSQQVKFLFSPIHDILALINFIGKNKTKLNKGARKEVNITLDRICGCF